MGPGDGDLRRGGVRRARRSSCLAGERDRRRLSDDLSGLRVVTSRVLAAAGAFFMRGNCDIEVTGAAVSYTHLTLPTKRIV